MKKILPIVSLLTVVHSANVVASDVKLDSEKNKLSYTIGADLGKNFHSQEIDINTKAFVAGLEDAMDENKLQLSDEQMKSVLKDFQQKLIAKRLAAYKKAAEENKKAGEKFLKENKKKSGVKTTDSGLQYKVLEKGQGKSPNKSDEVTVEYTGKLLNGTVFDSTEKSGKPATFKVNQVIPGWTEALLMMKQGATWEIYVPAKLAYGERGVGGPIGPNETLVFKVHLLSIHPTKTDTK
jgi:FKBP-type peptidyl-prolyl cis-trans isomerase FklB